LFLKRTSWQQKAIHFSVSPGLLLAEFLKQQSPGAPGGFVSLSIQENDAPA